MAAKGTPWGDDGFAAADGTDVQHSDQQVDHFNEEDAYVPGESVENGTEDGGEYDPEYVPVDSVPQVPAAPAVVPDQTTLSERPQSKPKMSGGFLVEASDDDDDDDDDDRDDEEDEGEEQDQGAEEGEAEEAAEEGERQEEAAAADENDDDDDDDDVAAANSRPAVPSQPQSQVSQPTAARGAVDLAPSTDTPPNVTPALASLDPVTLLEVRIQQDPRGDMDAWLYLIADYKRRRKFDDVRSVYHRFLDVFPQAADIWVEWIEMELGMDNFVDAEQLFGRCLMTVPNVKLWTVYLNYIRRRNELNNDPTGQARRTVTQSYEFVIDNIGVDRDSGNIWQDYIQFIRNGPGQIGGTGWQDQQKMDQLRKAFHRAITVPMSTVNNLWKEYDQFEMGLNKVTGRKFIQERSPGYMSAKSGNIALDNMGRTLRRTNLPRLPPAMGFDGDHEYRDQAEMWKRWIEWEKDDPLVLKADEPKVYTQRVLYVFKQALMALRFWPETWVDAAEWCFENDIRDNDKEMGSEFLAQGIAANPESVLLALKQADYIERTYPQKEAEKAEYARAVRKPFDDVLNTLYAMGDKVKEREKLEISTLKQAALQEPAVHESIEPMDDYGVAGGDGDSAEAKPSPVEERISAIQKGYAAETNLLSRTISHVWIAMARAIRRIQGKGNQTDGGLRKVFTDARQKGRLTSDVYVAVALLEAVVYKDPVGAKIFERGARLFPNDEGFIVEYLKFLHSKDDTTNARVVFETCVNRLTAKPETLPKVKPLYAYFHKYESHYGELSQIRKIEERMAELFPEDPKLSAFTARYSSDKFDPIAAPIIISRASQMRPKNSAVALEQPASARSSYPPQKYEQSPRPPYVRATASPKRPLGVDDEELNPPKRLARGSSPLKGAAGRRLDQQRRNQSSALHRDITFLLGILPPAHTYDSQRLNPGGLVSLLRDSQLPDYGTWKAQTGGQYRFVAPTSLGHGRQPSGEYQRPLSPYGRVASSSSGYRQSPLRSEAGSSYLANPYGSGDAGGAQPHWQAAQQGYGAPAQPAQYGGYRF